MLLASRACLNASLVVASALDRGTGVQACRFVAVKFVADGAGRSVRSRRHGACAAGAKAGQGLLSSG